MKDFKGRNKKMQSSRFYSLFQCLEGNRKPPNKASTGDESARVTTMGGSRIFSVWGVGVLSTMFWETMGAFLGWGHVQNSAKGCKIRFSEEWGADPLEGPGIFSIYGKWGSKSWDNNGRILGKVPTWQNEVFWKVGVGTAIGSSSEFLSWGVGFFQAHFWGNNRRFLRKWGLIGFFW